MRRAGLIMFLDSPEERQSRMQKVSTIRKAPMAEREDTIPTPILRARSKSSKSAVVLLVPMAQVSCGSTPITKNVFACD